MPTRSLNRYAQTMSLSDYQLLDALSRIPFVESTELALILGEPHATVHRRLSELLADGEAD
ncbi:MAG: helix-turn-helix domain-containing protein [Dehalococcoidia bacterium]|nr:helix-turn-helix domain-containing protein [Dehalococcoidia bacterium]